MINRAALMLKYRSPAVAWINDASPDQSDLPLTTEEVNAERTVYLISDEDAATPSILERWIRRNFRQLFESELEGWYTDPALWPKTRSLKVFREWFEVECHTVMIDTVGDVIFDDDL